MKKAALGLALVALLTGCASQTGIVPIGDGVYMSGAQDGMTYTATKVKARLYAEASEFCAKQGKKMVPLSDSGVDSSMTTSTSAEVKFRCS